MVNKCIDCGKELSDYRHKRCGNCANSGKNHPRGMKNKHHTYTSRKRMSEKKKLMSDVTKAKMGIASKKRWSNPILREIMLKNIFKSRQLKPNKCEKLLNKILLKSLPNEYKFVGNGKIFFNGLCPDFINCNGQKKIIELYGNYWHNKIETKKRDKRRLKTYAKYGYKTLIIWEHELKDLKKLKEKIVLFDKENKNVIKY